MFQHSIIKYDTKSQMAFNIPLLQKANLEHQALSFLGQTKIGVITKNVKTSFSQANFFSLNVTYFFIINNFSKIPLISFSKQSFTSL